jgi:hypothetical protein
MPLGRETSRTIFHARLGLVRIPQKAQWDTLRRTCVFALGGICGSCSAFQCVRGVKHRGYFSCLGGTSTNCRKSAPRHVTPHLCFASGGICGSHSAFHCVRETKHQRAIFHARGETSTDSTKSVMEHLTPNLCFCIRWDTQVTYCIVRHLRRETSTHYFSCLGGTTTDSKNNTTRHVTPNSCFTSGGICGSRIAFRCVRDANRRCSIFHARLGPVRIQQKA